MSVRATATGAFIGLALSLTQPASVWPKDVGDTQRRPTTREQDVPSPDSDSGPTIEVVRAALEKAEVAYQKLRGDLSVPILGIAAIIDKVDAMQGTYAEGLFAQTLLRNSEAVGDAADPLEFAWQQTDPTDDDSAASPSESVQTSHFAQAIVKLDQIAAYRKKLEENATKPDETIDANGNTLTSAPARSATSSRAAETTSIGFTFCRSSAEKVGFIGMAIGMAAAGSVPSGAQPQETPVPAQSAPAPDPKVRLMTEELEKAQAALAILSRKTQGKINSIQAIRQEALDRIDAWVERVAALEGSNSGGFDVDFLEKGLSLRSEISDTRDDVVAIRDGHTRVMADERLSDATRRRSALYAVERSNVSLDVLFAEKALSFEDGGTGESLKSRVNSAVTEMDAALDLLAAYIATYAGEDPHTNENDMQPARPPAIVTSQPSAGSRSQACIPNLNGSWAHMQTPRKDSLPSRPISCGARMLLSHSNADITRLEGIFVQFVPEIDETARAKDPEKAGELETRIARYMNIGRAPGERSRCLPPSVSLVTGAIDKRSVSLDLNTESASKAFAVITRHHQNLLQAQDEAGKEINPTVLFYDIGMQKVLCNVPIRTLPDTAPETEQAAMRALQRFQEDDEACTEDRNRGR